VNLLRQPPLRSRPASRKRILGATASSSILSYSR
jgi:hypothetical protein